MPSPPIWLWVCMLVPTAQQQSHWVIFTAAHLPSQTHQQRISTKSFNPLKLESLSQSTKESFLGICNKTMRRFVRLKFTHWYLLKPNPIQMGEKAPCSYPPISMPSTTRAALLTWRTDSWVTEDSQTTALRHL